MFIVNELKAKSHRYEWISSTRYCSCFFSKLQKTFEIAHQDNVYESDVPNDFSNILCFRRLWDLGNINVRFIIQHSVFVCVYMCVCVIYKCKDNSKFLVGTKWGTVKYEKWCRFIIILCLWQRNTPVLFM